ncbi:P27 family phage terminase small subunit [Corynebacterium propinquum]
MSRIDDEFERLRDGRQLSPFDREVLFTVAGLVLRVRDARDAVEREGQIIDDGKGFPIEHPALVIEKRASQEIRGWVKDHPNLFGQRSHAPKESSTPKGDKFGGFKLVN